MRPAKIILSACITLAIFAVTVILSCSKDKCDGIDCRNGGVCNGGKCTCPQFYYGDLCERRDDVCKSVVCKNGGACEFGKCVCPTGTKGKFCDSIYRNEYVHHYAGNGTDSTTTPVTVYANAQMIFENPQTLVANKMHLTLGTAMNMAIGAGGYALTLTNFSDTGTTFVLTPVFQNNLCYTGTGVVSPKKASLTLTITDMAASKVNIITFKTVMKT